MPVNLQHFQHAVNATKTEQEHFQSPCAVSGIQNNFNPTRNSESARRNAPDSVHEGEICDIKCKTGQPTVPSSARPDRAFTRFFAALRKGLNTLCVQSAQSRTRSSEIAFLRTVLMWLSTCIPYQLNNFQTTQKRNLG